MAVDLFDYVDVLRREVSPPGSTLFATVADDTMASYLADAFWEARLDGFVSKYEASLDGVITPLDAGAPDIPREQIALVVLYAGLKILRNQLINQTSRFKAKAGPVEFETENSANLMTEMAKQLASVRDRLLAVEDFDTPTFLVDASWVRSTPVVTSWGAEYLEWVGSAFAELMPVTSA